MLTRHVLLDSLLLKLSVPQGMTMQSLPCIPCMQVKLNVQRTLAIELQRLSVQFRKQQKAYLNRLRQKNGPSASGASFSVLDDTAGTSGREALDPDYDPGFNEIQVHLGPEFHGVRAWVA